MGVPCPGLSSLIDMSDLSSRVGRFLILIGVVLFIMFFMSDMARTPQYGLFLSSATSIIVGIFLISRKHVDPPDRFRLIKKLGKKSQKKESKK